MPAIQLAVDEQVLHCAVALYQVQVEGFAAGAALHRFGVAVEHAEFAVVDVPTLHRLVTRRARVLLASPMPAGYWVDGVRLAIKSVDAHEFISRYRRVSSSGFGSSA